MTGDARQDFLVSYVRRLETVVEAAEAYVAYFEAMASGEASNVRTHADNFKALKNALAELEDQ